jgi:hypothetical protein
MDEITDAIDRLARDAHEEIPTQELAVRLAAIWSMMAALNPELARTQRKYTGSTE